MTRLCGCALLGADDMPVIYTVECYQVFTNVDTITISIAYTRRNY